jgi:hypothetical protein
MAWSPVRRFNAGRFEVDHLGDYATLICNHPHDGTRRDRCLALSGTHTRPRQRRAPREICSRSLPLLVFRWYFHVDGDHIGTVPGYSNGFPTMREN